MSDHHVEIGRPAEVHAPGEHSHPTARSYIQIAVLLTVLTLAEIGIFYLNLPREIFVPLLLILASAKFVFVVLFYMHLKFDSKLFSSLFYLGLGMAIVTLSALVLLYSRFHPPPVPIA